MTNEMKIKLQEKLADPEFCSGMCDCLEYKEALDYFAHNGIELEEKEAIETWNAAMEESIRVGQLTDEELEKVAGGGCDKICLFFFKVSCACGQWGCPGDPIRQYLLDLYK